MTDTPGLTENSSTHLTCGNCGAVVEAEDVLCAACGALLAAYQVPSGSSASSAATTTIDTSVPGSDGASTSSSISSINPGRHGVYPAPASPVQPEITTTAPSAPAADAELVANATSLENSSQASMPTTAALRIIFPAPSARPVPDPERPIPSTSASTPVQSLHPAPLVTQTPQEKRRSNGALPDASRQPPLASQPVRQPVSTTNEAAESDPNTYPRRESAPPVRLPRFSGRRLGQIVPFALIALVIITRVPGMTALLGLLAVIGVAGIFLYGVLKATRGTRRRTTDMPYDREHYRNHHRRRKGR